MWRVLKEGLQLPPHSVWPCQQGKIPVDPTPVLDLFCYRVKIEAAFLNLQTTSKTAVSPGCRISHPQLTLKSFITDALLP